MTLPTVSSIIAWANESAVINDVQFFRGNRECPYIFKAGLFYYFNKKGASFALVMTSIHDLEAFA